MSGPFHVRESFLESRAIFSGFRKCDDHFCLPIGSRDAGIQKAALLIAKHGVTAFYR
jgi:hypothetical protein